MTTKMIHVFIEIEREIIPVGQLWANSRKGKDHASFQYNASWLTNPSHFALEPALALTQGSFYTDNSQNIFGSIGDSAPDRWGRMLMRRAEAHRAREASERPHTLNEIDYLLGVNDEVRQGSLRFKEKIDGPFLAQNNNRSIPPLLELPKLLSATEHVLRDEETDADLKILLAPGGSLGGARPKASVRDKNGQLMIAKFPSVNDHFNTVLWEAVALSLAKNAGINVPSWRLESISNKSIILINRFDRKKNIRIPFISAMSMIGARDNEQRSYLELVDAMRQYGAYPKENINELWRRIVFNILITNTDDHLRNHGFLYALSKGWELSPIYDINPTPSEISSRVLTTNITLDDNTASLEVAFSVIHEFGISIVDAKNIVKEVGRAVIKWQDFANKFGIKKVEIERMSSAFEHEDLRKSLLH